MRFSIVPGATLKGLFVIPVIWFTLMGLTLALINQMEQFLEGWPWSALCHVAGLFLGWLKLTWIAFGAREWMARNHERGTREVHN